MKVCPVYEHMREIHYQVDLISMLTLGVECGSVHLHLEKSLLGEPALLRGTLVRTELRLRPWEFGEILVLTVTPLPAGRSLCLRHRPAKGPPKGPHPGWADQLCPLYLRL